MSAEILTPLVPPRIAGDIRLRRVLIAIDFAAASDAALRLGADIARAFEAEVVVVHVLPDCEDSAVEPALGMRTGELLERRAGEAAARLRHVEAIAGRGHAHGCVRCGSAAAEILRLAHEASADLIVLGQHQGCSRSVAARVRRRAACPVLIARAPESGVPAPPSTAAPSIHGVLVATDGTPRSGAARRWGRALAGRLGCPAHVLHVEPGGGSPAARIVSCARELGDDLIVLGASRGPLRRAVFGSVADDLVRGAAASILAVGHESPPTRDHAAMVPLASGRR
jgi:nucleotide-binding universal stress UspA family protein